MNTRDTALRAVADPLADTEELIVIAELFPDLAPQCDARIARRTAGFERDVPGPWTLCRDCGREVPTRAVAVEVEGIAHWLCLRMYHTLETIADLSTYGVRVDQLPAWTDPRNRGKKESIYAKFSS